MIGSSIPGMAADVMCADIAARIRVAEGRQAAAAMTRELRGRERRPVEPGALRALAVLRRRFSWRVGQHPHDATA